MATITYKSVIKNAIDSFNSVQDALAGHKAKYNNAEIQSVGVYATGSDVTLVPSGELGGIIADQLQLKASGNINLTTNASTNVAKYATATVRSASGFSLAITDKAGTAVTVGSYDSTNKYYPLTASLTGTFKATTAGWFSSSSATDSTVTVGNLPKATFAVSNNIVKTSTAGYIPANTEVGTVGTGSVTSSATITATTLTAGTNGIAITTTKPSGTAESDYFTLKPYATASSSMTLTAGYISSKGTEGGASSTNKSTYYVAKSTGTPSTENFTFTPTVSNGTGTTTACGNVNLANATTGISTTAPTSGYYLHLVTDSKTDTLDNSVTTTEGYTKGAKYDANSTATVNASTTYVAIKSGSVDVTSGKTYSVTAADSNASVSGKSLTVSASSTSKVNLTKTEGYISGGAADSSTSITVKYSKTFDLTKLSSTLLASNIKSGVTIFGVTGTLTAGDLLPDFNEDATAAYILAGYKAYSESGDLITGTLADFSTAANTTNAAGATGAGLNIGAATDEGYTPTLNGTTLKVFLGSTGYAKKNTTYVTATVPTQTATVTSSGTEDQTVTPDSGKLLSSVTVNKMAGATFSGATLTPTYEEITSTISGATNIASNVTVNPSTVSGYISKIKIKGSANSTTATSGYTAAGDSNGTVTADGTLTLKIAAATTSSTYLTTTNTGFKAITATGYIGSQYYVNAGELGSVTGSVSVTTNSTSPEASGGNAIVDTTSTTYVKVNASGTATGNKVTKAGWVTANSTGTTTSDIVPSVQARIPALVSPEIKGTCSNASASITVGTATSYDDSTGAKKAGAKSNTGTISGSISKASTSPALRDKYIVKEATVSGNVSGTASASIASTATGSDVDIYVENLLLRMLGKSYTAVSGD